MSSSTISKKQKSGLGIVLEGFRKLHGIKFGSFSGSQGKIPSGVLSIIFSQLATLLENGVTLPKALSAVAEETSLKKQRPILEQILHAIQRGASFSNALSEHPQAFKPLIVQQIKIGEKSGTVAEVLRRIASNLENANDLKRKIIKRLSYPAVVTLAGLGVSIFMVLVIVPVFEETYEKARMPLPLPTQILIAGGDLIRSFGWLILATVGFLYYLFRRLRADQSLGPILDAYLLKIPIIGSWLRDYSMLEFMETLGTMLQSGYRLADSLAYSCGSVSNKAVNAAITKISEAIVRGERLSTEMAKHQYLFSPVVSQLVIIGEQTGNLAKSSLQVREHLRKDLERKADVAVSTLEPILTISMAILIGGILLAIYSPMFGMIDLVE